MKEEFNESRDEECIHLYINTDQFPTITVEICLRSYTNVSASHTKHTAGKTYENSRRDLKEIVV